MSLSRYTVQRTGDAATDQNLAAIEAAINSLIEAASSRPRLPAVDLSLVQTVPVAPGTGPGLAAGIHQSDVIIRAALTTGLSDVRANPWLLDFVFASLGQDDLTKDSYGEKEATRAKDWFLRTDVPVVMDYRMADPEAACLSISLVDSVEAEATLGDVHSDPQEVIEATWPPLSSAFTPDAYNPATGAMTLPEAIGAQVVVVPGMVVVDASGQAHSIATVTDATHVGLAAGSTANFHNAVIKGAQPRLLIATESLSFRESYRIGVHVHGEPNALLWLHSIVVFILLRYKQALLEGRGFERNTMSSAPFAKNEAFGRDNVWTRFVTLTGYVRHRWPKVYADRITGVNGALQFSPVGFTAATFSAEPGVDDGAWLAADGLGLGPL